MNVEKDKTSTLVSIGIDRNMDHSNNFVVMNDCDDSTSKARTPYLKPKKVTCFAQILQCGYFPILMRKSRNAAGLTQYPKVWGIISLIVFTASLMYFATSKDFTDILAKPASTVQPTLQPTVLPTPQPTVQPIPQPTAPPRMLSLGGSQLLCHERYGDTFRNILVVMVMFRDGDIQRSKESEVMYNCFFPNLKRYKYCNNATLETGNGITCMISESLESDKFTKPGFKFFQHRRTTFLQYEFLADAMTRWPSYEGYIFLQDDVVMNFWNFPARHDFKKVWRAVNFPDPDVNVWRQHTNLSLTSADNHCVLCSHWTHGHLVQINKFVNELTGEQKTRLFNTNSDKGLPTFRMANSDFYYVPKAVAPTFLELANNARKHIIFHEIAIPIIFDAILKREDYEIAPAATVSRLFETKPLAKFSLYNPCWDYFHSMKPSHDQEFHWMVETIFRYGPMTGTWDCGETGKEGIGPEAFERIGCGNGCPKTGF